MVQEESSGSVRLHAHLALLDPRSAQDDNIKTVFSPA